MRKYWAIFKLTWQNSFVYRADFIANIVVGLISFLVMYFIWSAVFNNQPFFGGYTFPAMMTYVLMTKFLHFTSRGNIGRQIGNEIKSGSFSLYLIKPIGYLRWWIFIFLADRGFEFVIRLIMLILFFALFPKVAIFSGIDKLLFFLCFLIISLIINYLTNVLIASFAFWFTDISLFRNTLMMIFDFLGGGLIPLTVMPTLLKNFSSVLPFQFTTFFPIMIYQGSLTSKEILNGILLAFIWIMVLSAIIKLTWGKGVKKYEAIGQ